MNAPLSRVTEVAGQFDGIVFVWCSEGLEMV